ncbi:hypothetical protein [Undibacterium sp. WLHG33]|uniref:hypothetical protein n=1 Tax=Undibacterium sp. WLHG33 TaxID=3412482 RepID=UPI003C2BA223
MNSSMFENIFRNLPGNVNWEGSFYEQLTEFGRWDAKEFWMLHLDLINAADKFKNFDSVDKELALGIVTLQSKIARLFIAHFNERDAFKIINLSEENLYAFKERFDLAVIGVFSGEVLSEDSFDLVNPLL